MSFTPGEWSLRTYHSEDMIVFFKEDMVRGATFGECVVLGQK